MMAGFCRVGERPREVVMEMVLVGTGRKEGEEGCDEPRSLGLCSSVVVILETLVSAYALPVVGAF